ncbi:hypothetical protein CANARDRAFT_40716 [[Candida] arabinofermentans NRRL YB-2248]|uniref:F-box domain-containing protein n=1 Tax=[Candida] arabinofermentans NRRL YB-2248 TaxID=983967 RepID=A0A1E4T7H6_9ASCO|nr:hypothetical protein CANARDRAFT_40716 [[Candida] arabinofermentans NRRL YB-2248]
MIEDKSVTIKDDTTCTFIKLINSFPIELQYRVMSYTTWVEYPIESLLQSILNSCSLLKVTLIEQLFTLVDLSYSYVQLGLGKTINYNSDNFKLLLKVIEYIKGRKGDFDIRCEYVIKTLRIQSLNVDRYNQFKELLENSANLEIIGDTMTKLKWFNPIYLNKIKKWRLLMITNVNIQDFESILLDNNLENLDLFGGPLEPEELPLVEKLFDKLIKYYKDTLNVNFNISINSIERLDYDSLPLFEIPNLNVNLDIKSTRGLKIGQLNDFICKSFGLESISWLTIHFEYEMNDSLKDASFLQNLSQLKTLQLYGDFNIDFQNLNNRKLDVLDISQGYANLNNIIAKKMIVVYCDVKQNTTICEGVEELTEISSFNWDRVKLPTSLINLNIENWIDKISFKYNINIFKNLKNMKKLRIIQFYDSKGLKLPSNLEHFDFEIYESISSGTIDFELPNSLIRLDAYQPALENLSTDKYPTNLQTLKLYVIQNEFEMILPKGLKYLIVKRILIRPDEEGESGPEAGNQIRNIKLHLTNIKDLIKIEVEERFKSCSVSVIVPDDEKKYLDNIYII